MMRADARRARAASTTATGSSTSCSSTATRSTSPRARQPDRTPTATTHVAELVGAHATSLGELRDIVHSADVGPAHDLDGDRRRARAARPASRSLLSRPGAHPRRAHRRARCSPTASTASRSTTRTRGCSLPLGAAVTAVRRERPALRRDAPPPALARGVERGHHHRALRCTGRRGAAADRPPRPGVHARRRRRDPADGATTTGWSSSTRPARRPSCSPAWSPTTRGRSSSSAIKTGRAGDHPRPRCRRAARTTRRSAGSARACCCRCAPPTRRSARSPSRTTATAAASTRWTSRWPRRSPARPRSPRCCPRRAPNASGCSCSRSATGSRATCTTSSSSGCSPPG